MKNNQIKVTYEADNVDGHTFLICDRIQFTFCKVNGPIARLLGPLRGNGTVVEFACLPASAIINVVAAN